MKLWAKTKEYSEGKFLVVRRDGTVPFWPHFVIGARDPAARAALLAYAGEAERLGYDPAFISSIRELADDFDIYRRNCGNGDADAAPHRVDDPDVLRAMRIPVTEDTVTITVKPGPNVRKPEPSP